MVLQEAADDSEAAAADALARASEPGAEASASRVALEAAVSLARIDRAELAAAGRWAAHVARSREPPRRALELAAGGRQATPAGRRQGLDRFA
jgi:hypothetical protein